MPPDQRLEPSATRLSRWRRAGSLGLAAVLGLGGTPGITGLRAEEFEAISARAAPDYVRRQDQDGSFRNESYAFGKGGYWSGPVADGSIDHLDFLNVAHIIAKPLASRHYLPSTDPKTAQLLIMVYWGTTYAPEHASESDSYHRAAMLTQRVADLADHIKYTHEHGLIPVLDSESEELTTSIAATEGENRLRDKQDYHNAKMLGYDSWWENTLDARPGTSAYIDRGDMMAELEEDRYFVILMAYDFQLLLREKKHKLLWETRFSIRQHVNRFDLKLPAMALEASKYFGQNSQGLIHNRVPEASVDIGALKDLGEPNSPPEKK